MIINDDAYVMLLVEGFFKTFTSKERRRCQRQHRGDHGLLRGQPRGVDDMYRKAIAAGGTASQEAQDYGFMYSHSFQDPDGHLWEVMWMDPAGPRRPNRPGDARAA